MYNFEFCEFKDCRNLIILFFILFSKNNNDDINLTQNSTGKNINLWNILYKTDVFDKIHIRTLRQSNDRNNIGHLTSN
jgi:hypothetical protein